MFYPTWRVFTDDRPGIKFLEVIQSSLTQCYHVNKEFLVECILKENARSCVTPTGYLFCCNDIYISCIVHHSTSDTCYFVLTYKNEQFCLSGPFNLNSLVKKVNEVYRLDDCISDGTQIYIILYFAHQQFQMKKERTS